MTKAFSSAEPMQAGAPSCFSQSFTHRKSEVERSGGTLKQVPLVGEGVQSAGQAVAARRTKRNKWPDASLLPGCSRRVHTYKKGGGDIVHTSAVWQSRMWYVYSMSLIVYLARQRIVHRPCHTVPSVSLPRRDRAPFLAYYRTEYYITFLPALTLYLHTCGCGYPWAWPWPVRAGPLRTVSGLSLNCRLYCCTAYGTVRLYSVAVE